MVTAFGVSDRGPVRSTNEDAFLIEDELGVLVVADGMGGHAAGEVASRIAIEAAVGFLRRSHEDTEYSWPYGIEPALSLNGNRVRTALHLANRRVLRAAESHDEYTGMGTTVVCVLIARDRMVVGHVGDSRLYLLRGGALTQLTQDDTWAAMVLENKAVFGRVAFKQQPMRNVLTNVLGARDRTEIHLRECGLVDGDRLLLSSDGLHGIVDSDELASGLAAATVEECAAALVQAAIAAGTRDNATALVADYKAADSV